MNDWAQHHHGMDLLVGNSAALLLVAVGAVGVVLYGCVLMLDAERRRSGGGR